MPVASRGARRMGGVHLALSRPFSRFKVGRLEGASLRARTKFADWSPTAPHASPC